MILSRRAILAAPLLAVAAPSPAAFAADAEAAAPIAALNQAILAAMRAGKATPFPQRYAALAPAVDRAFDFPGVLAASVGPRFATLPPPSRQPSSTSSASSPSPATPPTSTASTANASR